MGRKDSPAAAGAARSGVQRRHLTGGFCQTSIGSHYQPDELEFLRAVDHYKRTKHRPFPTWVEIFHLFRELGYAKMGYAKEVSHEPKGRKASGRGKEAGSAGT